MESWEPIQGTLENIECGLKDAVDIQALAEAAHLSPFYYQKLFRRLVGKPVMEYVKLRRLAHVADKLRTNGGKILDLALEYGFQNHETLTRSFKETYGMTPEAYRSNPVSLSHFIMPDLSLKYCLMDEGVPLVADGIVLEVNRQVMQDSMLFAGASLQNPINDTPGVDFLGELWKRFHERIGPAIPNKTEGGHQIGMSSAGREPGFFTYFAGAQVGAHTQEWVEQTMEGYVHENRALPAGNYVVCSSSAENFTALTTNALNKAIGYLFGTWLPAHQLQCESFMAEIYHAASVGSTDGVDMDIMVRLTSPQTAHA